MRSLAIARDWFRIFGETREKPSLLDKIRNFRCRIAIYQETDDFIIRSATTGNELHKVLELRHEIFVRKWQGRAKMNGLDVDHFDFNADHLLIISKRRQEIVGTYRLLSSHFTSTFYSQNEFHIEEFLRTPGAKLELGRACIHPDFRNGNTIDLLWKGLARYIEKSKSRHLFGCSSVRTVEPSIVAALLRDVAKRDGYENHFNVRPTAEYAHPEFSLTSASQVELDREIMPPLLRSYLLAGAKVHGLPAYDHEFACFDLFTVLDMDRLNPRFRKRFFLNEANGLVHIRDIRPTLEGVS